jgi:hypothetical protein
MLTAVLAGTGAASPSAAAAAGCQGWTGLQPPSPGTQFSQLEAVTVLSACNAWAVGEYTSSGPYQTLAEHWNGASWKVIPSPSPGGSGDFLTSVRAISPDSIWAVGESDTTAGARTLTEHWNGRAWKHVPSPSFGKNAELNGVRAVSARDVWAVGGYSAGGQEKALIEHWNGTRWSRLASPNPAVSSELVSVAATSRRDVWAVGELPGAQADVARGIRQPGGTPGVAGDRTYIVHWNGSRWRHVPSPSPSPGTSSALDAVGASSAGNAWAVGMAFTGSADKTLILHWNGRTWKRVASPTIGTHAGLEGVTVVSATSAWASGGGYAHSGAAEQPLILHWNGRRWAREASPRPSPLDTGLFGISAASAHDGWAVGSYGTSTGVRAFAVHCC